jgi:hypothetical protein
MPSTATRSPGRTPLPRRELNVVMPAQSSGAASAASSSAGMDASASTGAIMYSA